MASKKPRSKKYQGPKYVARNVLSTVVGGMSGTHADHLRDIQIKNHAAMVEMAQGRGNRAQWDLIVGAVNIANVLCEHGIGDEYRQNMLAARDALLAVVVRAVNNNDRFVFTGDELKAINLGLDVHDAQLENSRAIDIDRAAMAVEHRIRNRINTNSVTREVAKKAA